MGTIDIPGIGPVKDVYVYGGVAAGAAIVAYAWWRKKTTPAPDYVGASPDDYGATDYNSPLGNTGTNSTGNYTSVDPDTIDTNAKWTVAAVETLSNWGWDESTVGIALGKYLARLGLSEQQIEIVNTAVGALGPPPVGGPYPIKPSLPDTPSTGDPTPDLLPPPVLRSNSPEVWPYAIEVNWDQVPGGATEYEVESVPGTGPTLHYRGQATGKLFDQGLVHNGSYWLRARTYNSAGKPGPWSGQVLFKTKN